MRKGIYMSKQIGAIAVIYVFTALAWSILGTTIFSRSYSLDESLKGRVASIWGAPHVQKPPRASTTKVVTKKTEVVENGKNIVRSDKDYIVAPVELEGSKVNVVLDLEHRQKGLLWYSTYKVVFAADYQLKNTTDVENVDFVVSLPTAQASFDEMVVAVDGLPVTFVNEKSTLRGSTYIARGAT